MRNGSAEFPFILIARPAQFPCGILPLPQDALAFIPHFSFLISHWKHNDLLPFSSPRHLARSFSFVCARGGAAARQSRRPRPRAEGVGRENHPRAEGLRVLEQLPVGA